MKTNNTAVPAFRNRLAAISMMFVAIMVGSQAALAASASLSPATLNLTTGQSGSSVFSGNDGNSSKTFKWSYPSGLSVSKGSSSNLSSFSISTSYRTITIKTAGKGSFSATLNLSSGSAGTYVVKNTSAGFSFSPKDITVTVGSSTSSSGGGMDGGGGMGGGGGGAAGTALNAANGVSIAVRSVNKTMSDGQNVTFWVWCAGGGMGGGGGCAAPANPVLELGVGQQANVTLDMMMAPQENPPYHGHTIHWHGLDVAQSEDGVPETGASVLGDNYRFTVDSRYIGSHMYHCHVHTVKHLEMGMYAPFIVRAVDGAGNFVNVINDGGPSYDYEMILMYSSVDRSYHTATGDSTVFADYNPKYFLINGNEGRSTSAPAVTLAAAPGAKVALRLMGVQSVNTTFEIKNSSGSSVSFTQHNFDGYKLPSTKTLTKLDLSPGQTADVMVTLPSTTGTYYPQVTFKNLRNGGTYSNGTVYTRLTF
jgi:plastocyanin